jgi:hypothetical protein
VLESFDYVGVLTIEFFVMPDGALIANEMAPRVHNSGHWTIEGALTSQFEQHIRAVAGWPLGPTTRIAAIEMLNLIGADADAWPELAADPTARPASLRQARRAQRPQDGACDEAQIELIDPSLEGRVSSQRDDGAGRWRGVFQPSRGRPTRRFATPSPGGEG